MFWTFFITEYKRKNYNFNFLLEKHYSIYSSNPEDFYWDILRLFHEVKAGIVNCKKAGHEISAIGIDTWGVDYGLLDETDRLLSNPHHYRDARTQTVELTDAERREIYDVTGIQHAFFNTLFQFMCECESIATILINLFSLKSYKTSISFLIAWSSVHFSANTLFLSSNFANSL